MKRAAKRDLHPAPNTPAGLVLFLAGREPDSCGPRKYEQLAGIISTAQKLVSDPATIEIEQLSRHIDRVTADRAVIYQASGVLADQQNIDPASALNTLRLRAWSEDQPLPDICTELLSRN